MGNPAGTSDFVAAMEQVLDVYKRAYDPKYPVVCMHKSPRRLIAQARSGIVMRPGQPKRVDYEYIRKGVVNIFMATEPLAGHRVWRDYREKEKNGLGEILQTAC